MNMASVLRTGVPVTIPFCQYATMSHTAKAQIAVNVPQWSNRSGVPVESHLQRAQGGRRCGMSEPKEMDGHEYDVDRSIGRGRFGSRRHCGQIPSFVFMIIGFERPTG
jgi:hypothetical protein